MLGDQIRVKASEWLNGESSASFEQWKEGAEHQAMSKEDIHRYKLMQKYAGIWRMKTQKGKKDNDAMPVYSGICLHVYMPLLRY
jgi:hypothetical protein